MFPFNNTMFRCLYQFFEYAFNLTLAHNIILKAFFTQSYTQQRGLDAATATMLDVR